MNKEIKAVAYYRMSSDRQEASIDDQRAAVEKYAEDNGYQIIREYRDEGISGAKSEERKGFQKLIADASERGDFRVILVWDQDRFSRFDPLEANFYWYQLDRANVQLVSVAQGAIDWHSLAGWLSASITQHGKAQFLRDLARSSVRGMRRRKLEGGWLGGVPFGYVCKDGRLALGDPDDVALVRRIFAERAKGHGLKYIATQLNDDRIASPQGKLWCHQSVRHIVDRRSYTGDCVFGGEYSTGRYEQLATEITTIRDTHPPIIDRETWDAVKRIPTLKRRANGRCEDAPLSGLLRCGCCGGPMCARTIGQSRRYVCARHRAHGTCGPCAIHRGPILKAVEQKIRAHILMGSRDRLEAAIQRELDRRRAPSVDTKAAAKKLATLDRQIERAASRMLVVDDAVVPHLEKQLLALKDRRQQLAATVDPPVKRLPSAKAISAKIWELDRILSEAPATTVRAALAQYVDHIRLDFQEVAPTKRGRRYEFTGGVIRLCTARVQEAGLGS